MTLKRLWNAPSRRAPAFNRSRSTENQGGGGGGWIQLHLETCEIPKLPIWIFVLHFFGGWKNKSDQKQEAHTSFFSEEWQGSLGTAIAMIYRWVFDACA